MKPGLTRAVPMAFLGFILGLLFVVILRWMQGLDPVFDPGIAFIVAAFTTAGFFVWGMGAFDSRMNTHPHEPEVNEYGLIVAEPEDHEVPPEEEERVSPPNRVLGFTMWQVTFWTVVTTILVFAFAVFPTGLTLQTSADPLARRDAIGSSTLELPFGGPELELSQLALFAGMIIVILAALAAIGGGIALLMTSLSRNVKEAKEGTPVRLSYQETPKPLFVAEIIKLVLIVGAYVMFYALGSPISDVVLALVGMVLLGVVFGYWVHIHRAGGLVGREKVIDLIKAICLTVSFVVMFPLMWILHYEVFVGLPFARPEWLRVLASLGGTLLISPVLTFVLFPDQVSALFSNTFRGMARRLRGPELAASTSTEIQKAEEANS